MATALKLKNDIKKLKSAIVSKKTPSKFIPKLKEQLKKAENELSAMKKSGRPRKVSTTKGTQKTLSALQKLVQKKKFAVYQGQRVDLKKDAGEGAFAVGRRVSKGLKANQFGSKKSNKGNVYYEYRPNRLDVKQPRKSQSYPKLEKGGYMADGGRIEKHDGKLYKEEFVGSNRWFEVDSKYKMDKYEHEAKAFQENNKGNLQKRDEHRLIASKLSDESIKLLKGGIMAKGGMVDYSKNGYVKAIRDVDGKLLKEVKIGDDIYKYNSVYKTYNSIKNNELLHRSKYASGGMMAKGGVNSKEKFYEGQSIMLKPITTKSLIDALPEWNKYANKELVIEKIEFDSPYKKATKAFVRSTGDKVPFNIYLNDSIEQYADGGMMADGGKIKEIEFDGTNWYLTYIDSTHFFLSNSKDFKGNAYHIGQFRNRPFYEEVKDWLKRTSKDDSHSGMMADGGEIYSLAENMSDAEYKNKLSRLNEKQKRTYESLVRLGDSPKLALATTLLSNEVKWSEDTIRAYTMADGGMMAKGGEIGFENSNLYLNGFGKDANGNSIVKVSFPNQRAFSIQTNGVLEFTHEKRSSKIKDLSESDISKIEKEVVEYLKEYGSKEQKERLKTYSKYASGGMMAKGGKTTIIDEVSSMSFRNNYDEYEMIVISKELNKDGGKLIKDRFLVSAKDIDEAKKIATDLWKEQFGETDLSIVKVMSAEAYKHNYLGYMAKGGAVQHGLKMGDKIVADQFWDNSVVVDNPKTGRAVVYLETGKRVEGGMMADGGETEEEEKEVIRGYFEDEPYEYAQGGKVISKTHRYDK